MSEAEYRTLDETHDWPRWHKLRPEYTLPTSRDELRKASLTGMAIADAQDGGKNRERILAAARRLDDEVARRAANSIKLGAADAVQQIADMMADLIARAPRERR